MQEAEFDKFAAEYRSLHAANIAVTGEKPEYFVEYKIVDLAREYALGAGAAAPAEPRVLDFGAGIGYSVPFLARHLPAARVTCLDVSQKSLEIGAANHGARAEFRHFDGVRIPFADAHFDLALASCVFHHIPHAEHAACLRELARVLKPGALLCVFEHNPFNPLTRHAVNTCVFDEHAQLITARTLRRRVRDAGFARADVRYRIFFPHALRGLRRLERRMTWLPLGAQYYVAARK